MKKILGIMALLLTVNGFAEDFPPNVLLDKVNFQITAREWVKTQTVLLTISINATLTDVDLVKARNQIMERLNQIAKGDWQLVQFERSQDNSGLEKLFVLAQARVDQNAINDVYQRVKSVSKPGTTYEVSSVEFRPSLEEVQQARILLRSKLYQQVQDELARLNKIYTPQMYSLNNLEFMDGDAPVVPQAKMQAREMLSAAAMPNSPPALTVSNELSMTAIVQAASNRNFPGAVPAHGN